MAATHLTTLRLRSAEPDSPALRLGLTRELGGADPTPSSLPPSAILMVRRMEDPLPGSLGSGGFRPPAVWERALRERLGELCRHAARPDRWGRVPANAPAVLFADRAELVACRLRAHAAREPASWWTPRLPAELDDGPAAAARDPVALLARRIRELPAVLQRLAEWGAVTPVLRSLDEPEAMRLLEELVREWSLPAALAGHRTAAETATEKHQVKGTPSENEPVASRRAGELRGGVVEHGDDPWARWLPAEVAAASKEPAVRALAGVAFGLVRSPSRLRSPVLVERVADWWRRVEAGEKRDPEPWVPAAEPRSVSEAQDAPRLGLQITETSRFREDALSQVVPTSADTLSLPDVVSRGSESRPGTSIETGPEPASPDPPHPELFDRPAVESPAQRGSAGSGPTLQGEAPEPTPTSDPLPFLIRSGDTFLTAWGGVFYLIHLLEDQELPRAAEDDWRLETLAGPWGTLDLVARGLLAHRFPGIAEDPLWQVLEHLAAWPDDRDQDGANETPDEPLYPLPAGCPPHLGGWLASALPAFRARLLLALGEDATREADDPVERLLALPARIHLTSSHLDVVTGLDQIWLPARRAGLDRNPGWLPDYGRVVLLHYEDPVHFEEPGGTPS